MYNATREPEQITTARQQQPKHVSTAAKQHATIEVLLEMFSVWSLLRLYGEIR
jgi:hypothetical protein